MTKSSGQRSFLVHMSDFNKLCNCRTCVRKKTNYIRTLASYLSVQFLGTETSFGWKIAKLVLRQMNKNYG